MQHFSPEYVRKKLKGTRSNDFEKWWEVPSLKITILKGKKCATKKVHSC